MYMPSNAISINAITPKKQANFAKIWRVNITPLKILKFMIETKESLVDYVDETFFIQPKSLEIFLASQKRLLDRQPPQGNRD